MELIGREAPKSGMEAGAWRHCFVGTHPSTQTLVGGHAYKCNEGLHFAPKIRSEKVFLENRTGRVKENERRLQPSVLMVLLVSKSMPSKRFDHIFEFRQGQLNLIV